jgi:hypothetical protein
VVIDYVGGLLCNRGKAGCRLFCGSWHVCANLGKQRVACGFSWLLRVTDHEAVLMDSKLFPSWVHRSLVLLKRRSGRQTSSRWRFSRKFDWTVQVIPQHAIKATRVLSTRKMVIGRQKLGWNMEHFTTALGLYGGVLWSGDLQGSILHEMIPSTGTRHTAHLAPTATATATAATQAQSHTHTHTRALASCFPFPAGTNKKDKRQMGHCTLCTGFSVAVLFVVRTGTGGWGGGLAVRELGTGTGNWGPSAARGLAFGGGVPKTRQRLTPPNANRRWWVWVMARPGQRAAPALSAQ